MRNLLSRIKEIYRTHHDFILLLILFAAFRWLALLFFRPGGYFRDWSDYTTFLGIAAVSDQGLYPFVHYWLEWPPLFPWLFVLLYRLSLGLPPWEESRLWFALLVGTTLLLFETGNLVLIYAMALKLYDKAKAQRCALFYAALFVPIYVMVGYFDSMPLFFALLGLYLVLLGREAPAGVALGLGFMTKITPALVVPVGLRTLPGRVRHLVAVGLTVCLLAAPFVWMAPAFLLTSFRSVLGRSSWETVWALLEGYYSYGEVAGDRLDPTVTDFSIHPSTLPWWLIGLVFAALFLWLYSRPRDYSQPVMVVTLAALTFQLFMLYTKGFSPQFSVYLLPFVVLLLPHARGVLYAVALNLITFAESAHFVMFPDEHWFLAAIVVARTAFLLMLCLEYGAIFFSLSSRRFVLWRRRVFAGLLALMLVGSCPAAYRLSQAYYSAGYHKEEYRPAIDFLRTQTRCLALRKCQAPLLIVADQDLYRRFYPFLRNDLALCLADSALTGWEGRLDEVTAGRNEWWFWQGGRKDQAVEDRLKDREQLAARYVFGPGGKAASSPPAQGQAVLLFYSDREPQAVADLGDAIRLAAYSLEPAQARAGEEIRLILYWQCLKEMDASYIVFTHLLDGQGRVLAGQDNSPVKGTFPTTEWAYEQLVQDEYALTLPDDAPPGSYAVEAGMYDAASGERLKAADGGDRVLLGEVQVGAR